jgi:hypothetical protein
VDRFVLPVVAVAVVGVGSAVILAAATVKHFHPLRIMELELAGPDLRGLPCNKNVVSGQRKDKENRNLDSGLLVVVGHNVEGALTHVADGRVLVMHQVHQVSNGLQSNGVCLGRR